MFFILIKILKNTETITDSVFVYLTSTVLIYIEDTMFIYQKIASRIETQIYNGVLKFGDKLPSLRIIQQEHGVSISTALQAYYSLEAKSLITTKPRSGYYVIFSIKNLPKNPVKTSPDETPSMYSKTDIIIDLYHNLNVKGIINFSLGAPTKELLPVAKLSKTMHETIGKLNAGGTYYEKIEGSENLRRQIAQRTLLWGGNLQEKDIVITAGCTQALSLSLMAVTSPGDTIVVESPVFFGILQLANILGLKVIELPTDSITGMDLEALKKVVQQQKISAILIISNFNNPLGSVMPDANKKEIVKIIQEYEIPLIEDDICGEIYYGKNRPTTCKSFDTSGLVLWVGSFSKTLSGGYRVGWVAPGKFLKEILRLKLCLSSSSTPITQETIAAFLIKGRYDYHLRKLRNTLQANSIQYITTIAANFPEDTRVSKPQGSFLLWVELNSKIDCNLLFEKAKNKGIVFTPGSIFTLQEQYKNCLRLSYAIVWSSEIKSGLIQLGNLIKEELED